MSLTLKESNRVVSTALGRITASIKSADPKNLVATINEIEQYITLAKLVIQDASKQKPKKKTKGKKRKIDSDVASSEGDTEQKADEPK